MGKPKTRELVERAAGDIFMTTDLVSGDSGVTGGGRLSIEQADTFIRMVVDQPTIVNQVRTVQMNGPQMRLNKIVMTDRLLHKPTGSITPLASSDYAAPSTSYIDLNTQELVAEVRIPYDVLEDNIEKEAFEQTVMELVAQKVSLELEELILTGDTAHSVLPTGGGWSATDMRFAQDGVLKMADGYSCVYSTPPAIDEAVFAYAIGTLPARYQRFKQNMAIFCSHRLEFDYAQYLGTRMTSAGDNRLSSFYNDQLQVFGNRIVPCAIMPEDTYLFTDPKNIILGIQRRISIEVDRDISSRVLVIVITIRLALQTEDKLGMVKVTGVYA